MGHPTCIIEGLACWLTLCILEKIICNSTNSVQISFIETLKLIVFSWTIWWCYWQNVLMINEKNIFLTVSWLSGLLSAEIFISTGPDATPNLWKQLFSAVRASGGYPGNVREMPYLDEKLLWILCLVHQQTQIKVYFKVKPQAHRRFVDCLTVVILVRKWCLIACVVMVTSWWLLMMQYKACHSLILKPFRCIQKYQTQLYLCRSTTSSCQGFFAVCVYMHINPD